MIKICNGRTFRRCFVLIIAFSALYSGKHAFAAVLSPGTITTCGEIVYQGSPATYTLGSDISTSSGACLIITSAGPAGDTIIDGDGHTITGDIVGDGVNPGDPGYNFTVENATVTGTVSSNGADNSGYGNFGGYGGSIDLVNSTTTDVQANGGNNPDSGGNGGNGGSITMTKTNLGLAGGNISAAGGGAGSFGSLGGDGILVLNFTTLDHTGTVLSSLYDFVLNGPGNLPGDLGSFGGGEFTFQMATIDNISQCDLSAPGIYTLGADLTGDCTITSDGVVLDGDGHTLTGNMIGDGVGAGNSGYDFFLENMTITGTTSSNGIDNSGDFGGSGGSITITNSTTTTTTANGGNGGYSGGSGGSITITNSTTATTTANGGGGGGGFGGGGGSGGSGGSITITKTSIIPSDVRISVSGGVGDVPSDDGTDGSLTLNYTTFDHFGLYLPSLSDLVLNGPGGLPGDLGPFAGGVLSGFYPGDVITDISQCNLSVAGTYTLGADLTGDCTIASDGVTLDGDGHTITGSVIGDNATGAGYDFTLKDVTVTATTSSNGTTGGSITITNDDIVLADEHISVVGSSGTDGALTLNYTTLDYADAVLPQLSALTLNGPGSAPGYIGGFNGGGFSSPGDVITDVSKCHIIAPGTYTLGADLTGNCYIKSDDVTLDGDGHTITGDIVGDGYSRGGYDYTLQNITVVGTVSSPGISSSFGGSDGSGGSITIENSTTTGAAIYLSGYDYGGSVNITSSSSLDLAGVDIYVASNTTGGSVNITSSSSIDLSGATINASGGTSGTLTLNYTSLNYDILSLSALSDLVLNGPGGLPGDMGAITGGSLGALPGDTLTNISQCLLSASGTYTLGADLVGTCLITSNGVIIDGAGHTINGGVSGDAQGAGASGYDFTLENVTVTGTISSNGGISTYPFPEQDGNGGSITIINSTVATTTANGGGVGTDGGVGIGGTGGSITISSSTATLVEANGGSISLGGYQFPRDFLNLIAGNVPTTYGGGGGTITISTSTTDSVISNGGDTILGSGGNGGIIRITNSLGYSNDSVVSANGGSVAYCGYGGSGGTVSIFDSTYGTSTTDKGGDATTTYANGGYCANQVSSPGGSVLSGGSGGSGSSQIIGRYTPSVLPQTPITTALNTNPVPTAQPIPTRSSDISGSFVPILTAASSSAVVGVPAVHSGAETFRSSGTAVVATIQKIAKGVTDTANAVASSPGSKPIQTVGFIAGLVASVGAYAETGTALPLAASELLLTPLRLWGIALVGLGIRKRGRPWGTIYDSETKQPIDPAFVTVKDANGKVVAESITDLDGRYGFLLPDGTYYISVKKTNYEFPSKKMSGKASDELYSDLYFGEPVTVRSGEVLDKNIPMDRKNFDWNQQAKRDQNLMLFHSVNEKAWAVVSKYIYGVGLIVSVIIALAKPSFYDITILVLYAAVLVFLEFGIKDKKLGYVLDKNTGEPLSYAIIHVTTPDGQVVFRSAVCDGKGRYYCIVPKGQYRVQIMKKNKDGTYSAAYESASISNNSGILNKNFIV